MVGVTSSGRFYANRFSVTGCHADCQGGRNKTLSERGHLPISYLDQIWEVWPNIVFLGLTQTSPRLRSVAAVPPEVRTYHLSKIIGYMYTCGVPDKFEYRRYSVLGYLVLIDTKVNIYIIFIFYLLYNSLYNWKILSKLSKLCIWIQTRFLLYLCNP